MKNRTVFLVFCALFLGAVYAYKFTDWFASEEIQIKFRNMGERSGNPSGAIIFYLVDKEYQLTSVKVVSADEAATNKYPHALWHLVSESNSVPVTDFTYGMVPAGMKPKIAGMAPEPLQAGVNYRIYVEAGKVKGKKEFQMRGSKL